MNRIRNYAWALPLAVLVGFGLSTLVGSVHASFSDNGERPPDVALANSTRGTVFGTAAINADATVASCFNCSKTTTVHIGTGQYQVGFGNFGSGAITANNGYSRWVQPDTLSTGATNAYCTTADRSGAASAVYVACYSASSTGSVLTDTPFFIFVAR
jgi:hypothetical protein